MKLIFCMILFMLMIYFGCGQTTTAKENKIKFYRRDYGGTGKEKTYFDYLIINDYSDGTLTADSFYKIAKEYRDTSRTDHPVSAVTFLGQKSNERLPKADFNNPIARYKLIDFGFTEDTTGQSNGQVKLSVLGIWVNEEPTILWSKIPADKIKIDSILKSKEVFKNKF